VAEFPVLVTGTMHYVVWVDADNAEEAHASVHDNPHDWVDDNTAVVDAWVDGEKDPAETAHFIRLYGSQFMPQHDAHVHTHRWATRNVS
jgi:hypothetical protein